MSPLASPAVGSSQEVAHISTRQPGRRWPNAAMICWVAERQDEATATLAQVARAERAKVVYSYDFGDDWRHDIVVEKIIPAVPGVAYPRCTGGRRSSLSRPARSAVAPVPVPGRPHARSAPGH